MIEYRNCLLNNFSSKDTVLGIGSEHCSREFIIDVERKLFSFDKQVDCFHLVTPKTDQNNLKDVVSTIERVLLNYSPATVVVNDIGILQYLKGTGIDITLGRVLNGSFNYRYDLDGFIDQRENDSVVKNFLSPSIIHSDKIELYSKMGVCAVELCPLRYEEVYIKNLKAIGWRLHMHHHTYISAISKTCYCLERDDNQKTYKCKFDCVVPRNISLSHIQGFNPLSRNSISEMEFERLQDSFPNYYVAGNAIYMINDSIVYDKSLYDIIVVDCALFSSAL